MDYSGSKLALFIGPSLLVIQRDDYPHIPFPGLWDLPGGGREGAESPVDCTLRETAEEVGLQLAPSDLIWSRQYTRSNGLTWFFAAHLPPDARGDVRLGSEGQRWELWEPDTYVAHPQAVPHFREQVRDYLELPDTAKRYLAS